MCAEITLKQVSNAHLCVACACQGSPWGVSSVPFPFRFPYQLHCELVSSLLALDATELVSQLLTAVEMINIHVILVLQKRLVQ